MGCLMLMPLSYEPCRRKCKNSITTGPSWSLSTPPPAAAFLNSW
ncbi:hypothetical protein OROHE_006743 [Orobanche hederae]